MEANSVLPGIIIAIVLAALLPRRLNPVLKLRDALLKKKPPRPAPVSPPAPLVRDSKAGWRSGRLDAVLGGDFDLIGEAQR